MLANPSERNFLANFLDDRFHTFFASLDSIRKSDLLYLSSVGLPAARRQMLENGKDNKSVEQIVPEVSDDEGDDVNGQDG